MKNFKFVSTLAIFVVAVVAALIAPLVIVRKNRKNKKACSDAQNELEISSRSRDISESSLITNLA